MQEPPKIDSTSWSGPVMVNWFVERLGGVRPFSTTECVNVSVQIMAYQGKCRDRAKCHLSSAHRWDLNQAYISQNREPCIMGPQSKPSNVRAF